MSEKKKYEAELEAAIQKQADIVKDLASDVKEVLGDEHGTVADYDLLGSIYSRAMSRSMAVDDEGDLIYDQEAQQKQFNEDPPFSDFLYKNPNLEAATRWRNYFRGRNVMNQAEDVATLLGMEGGDEDSKKFGAAYGSGGEDDRQEYYKEYRHLATAITGKGKDKGGFDQLRRTNELTEFIEEERGRIMEHVHRIKGLRDKINRAAKPKDSPEEQMPVESNLNDITPEPGSEDKYFPKEQMPLFDDIEGSGDEEGTRTSYNDYMSDGGAPFAGFDTPDGDIIEEFVSAPIVDDDGRGHAEEMMYRDVMMQKQNIHFNNDMSLINPTALHGQLAVNDHSSAPAGTPPYSNKQLEEYNNSVTRKALETIDDPNTPQPAVIPGTDIPIGPIIDLIKLGGKDKEPDEEDPVKRTDIEIKPGKVPIPVNTEMLSAIVEGVHPALEEAVSKQIKTAFKDWQAGKIKGTLNQLFQDKLDALTWTDNTKAKLGVKLGGIDDLVVGAPTYDPNTRTLQIPLGVEVGSVTKPLGPRSPTPSRVKPYVPSTLTISGGDKGTITTGPDAPVVISMTPNIPGDDPLPPPVDPIEIDVLSGILGSESGKTFQSGKEALQDLYDKGETLEDQGLRRSNEGEANIDKFGEHVDVLKGDVKDMIKKVLPKAAVRTGVEAGKAGLKHIGETDVRDLNINIGSALGFDETSTWYHFSLLPGLFGTGKSKKEVTRTVKRRAGEAKQAAIDAGVGQAGKEFGNLLLQYKNTPEGAATIRGLYKSAFVDTPLGYVQKAQGWLAQQKGDLFMRGGLLGLDKANIGMMDTAKTMGTQLAFQANTQLGFEAFKYNPVTIDPETGEFRGGTVTANPFNLNIQLLNYNRTLLKEFPTPSKPNPLLKPQSGPTLKSNTPR